MSEKMTDKELMTLQWVASGEDESWDDRWRGLMKMAVAHIAALTAELDESRASSDDYRHGCEELTRDRNALRERVKALEAERDGLLREREAEADGNRILRQRFGAQENETFHDFVARLHGDSARLSAMESELNHSRKTSGKAIVEARERAAAAERAVEVWRTECRAAESSLSAIRQRALDEAALIRKGEVCAIMGFASEWDATTHNEVVERGDFNTVRDVAAGIARYILGDDARPSAPPEAFTHEKGLDAGVFDDAPLNPDATGEADQPLPEGPLEPADMTDEESGRVCADAGVDVESGVAKCLETVAAKRAEKPAPFRSEDEDPPLLLPQTPARHYPTTSEAIATLHAFANGFGRPADYVSAVSLLERRMGAMARAATEVLSFFPVGTEGPRKYSTEAQALSKLRLALTDAPSVFTLEEARKAVAGQGLSDEADAEIVARLAAMRRRP